MLLLTGAALGDRFGRRRMFAIGVADLHPRLGRRGARPGVEVLNVARAVQGLGGAIVMPLTLTILSAAVPAERRGLALGAWGGIGGLAVAFGPLVGGAVVEGISWQWIFWLNVPIGLVLIPLALARLQETHGPAGKLDLPGSGSRAPACSGSSGALVRGNEPGLGEPRDRRRVRRRRCCFVAAFVVWELRAEQPMLPMRFFRNRTFALANSASLFMFFGMFGSIFLLAQFFQTVQGYSPFELGSADPARGRSRRCSSRRSRARSPTGSRRRADPRHRTDAAGRRRSRGSRRSRRRRRRTRELIVPFMLAGVGMALFFAPMANVVLSAVRPEEEGQASGANNAIRELGGVFGVAVLAAVFPRVGGYESADGVRATA